MGEIENDKQNLDGSEQTVDEETETSEKNDSEDNDTEEGADTDDNNDEGSDDEEETDDDEEETDDKKSKKSTSEDDKKKEDDEKEPPTRKRPSDFARERIERKNSKNKGKDSKASDTDEDDEEDIDPEDEKTVGKVVAKALKPFIEKEAQREDDKEVETFLKNNPDFKSYEAKARKYMAHPSRKDVPIEEIFYGVAGKDLMAIGAKRAKKANIEAKKTASAGGSADAGGVKTNSELSGKEFADKQAEVRAKIADKY